MDQPYGGAFAVGACNTDNPELFRGAAPERRREGRKGGPGVLYPEINDSLPAAFDGPGVNHRRGPALKGGLDESMAAGMGSLQGEENAPGFNFPRVVGD